MSKTVSAALKAHMAQSVTTLALCWQITRVDGTNYYFTSFDQDLVITGQIYKSTTGFTASQIETGSTGEVDNLEVQGFFDDTALINQDMRNGRFDYASIYVFLVNWADLSMGILRLRRGWFGEVTRSQNNSFVTELRGLTQALVQEWGVEFQPICRADLGDAQCKFDLASVTVTSSVGAVLNQKTFNASGAITFPTLPAPSGQQEVQGEISFRGPIAAGTTITVSDGVISHSITAIADVPLDQAATYFANFLNSHTDWSITYTTFATNFYLTNGSGQPGIITKSGDTQENVVIRNFTDNPIFGGVVTWLTGLNAGVSMEVKYFDASSNSITLFLSMLFPIQVGDTFSIYPGCDKRRTTCFFTFNNILNFRGEPDMPGLDTVLSFPEA